MKGKNNENRKLGMQIVRLRLLFCGFLQETPSSFCWSPKDVSHFVLDSAASMLLRSLSAAVHNYASKPRLAPFEPLASLPSKS